MRAEGDAMQCATFTQAVLCVFVCGLYKGRGGVSREIYHVM